MRLFGIAAVSVLSACLASAEVRFNRDIRPIMSDTCFRCHGPDKSTRMAGLRLDIREEALKQTKSGVRPIVPGKPGESAIVDRIFASNPARLMPPKYAHKELSEKQKQTVRDWVAEGAKYESHWSYEPIRKPEGNSIDSFVRARLARENLKPSPEADRRTLIRRVTLDLTGLPPAPVDVEAFVADKSPDAYEKVVDRLLATTAYAEKQTMHWLDAVRYADTCGFHGDNIFPAWPYRDYVLRSFRDNKPFDVFTREQLAGDLIPNPSRDQLIASAYNRMNRTSAEGGVQPKEYLAKYAADRVRTTSTVWLGSTMGCAECHDHKFDPFSARDFYSMKAFFADIDETGLVPDRGPKAWGTQMALPTPEQKRRLQEMKAYLAGAKTTRRELTKLKRAEWPSWQEDIVARYERGDFGWQFQRPTAAKSANGARLTVYNDEPVESETYSIETGGATLVAERKPGNGLVVASGPNPDNETYTVTLKPGDGTWTALGVEIIQDEGLPGVRIARGADRFVLTEVEAELNGRSIPLVLATASTSVRSDEHPVAGAIDGKPDTGWGIATYGEARNIMLSLRFGSIVSTRPSDVLTVRLRHDSSYRRATIGRFRLALATGIHAWPEPADVTQRRRKSMQPGLPENVYAALKTAPDKRLPVDHQAVRRYFEWLTGTTIDVEKQEAEIARFQSAIPRIVITRAAMPGQTRILPRGNWMDETGDVVDPAIPAFLGKLDTAGRRADRLDLADWITSTDNPLTARVFVNRQWRQLFGTGLSKSLDDLGSQGELPSHPELLDWLAAEFKSDWNVKRLVRTIVTSHTYRQSSESTQELDARDPDNRLLARQTRMRVDAEIVRDIALSVSGLLTDKFGGPSAKPYQPDGYLAALNFPKREYSASVGEDLYRRGVYTLWQRTFLHPSLMTFDAPTREECTVNRANSNTPLQALVLLNDVTYLEAARAFAQNILKNGASLQAQLDWAFERALSRKPSAEERMVLSGLYQKSLSRFAASPQSAAKLIQAGDSTAGGKPVPLAAMTMVARAILNLHETITRN